MPESSDILMAAARIAQSGFVLAVAWHVALGAALVALLLLGWRPERRLATQLLALPLASVSALAWLHGNPFNGAVFGALAAALLALSFRAPRGPVVAAGPAWVRAAGAALVVFAWFYPHFLEEWPLVAYVAGAPLGLLPCPSLSLVTGLVLLGDGPGGRAVSWIIAGATLVYGLMGIAQLGVGIDVALVAGAIVLAGQTGMPRRAKTALWG